MAFQKGQSGNPGGRPGKTAEQREVEALARQHGPEAIAQLRTWMRYKKNPAVSVRACEIMLDRGFGKPRQAHEHSGPQGGAIQVVTGVERSPTD